MEDIAAHIGEPKISTRILVRQSRVIDTHQMQDCRVVIVYVYRVFHGMNAVVVGRTVDGTAANTGSGQQASKRAVPMVAAWAYIPGGSSKLRTDGNKCVI